MSSRYKLPAKLNRKIGLAMHDYAMLDDGDRVLVAVSGGVDSLALAFVLKLWQQKAPIDFELTVVHIDHGFWRGKENVAGPRETIGNQLDVLAMQFEIEPEWKIDDDLRTCFLCSRNRRTQLFDLARQKGINKIALGHHKDDLIETFMLNVLYSGNISTMVPRQNLFAGTLSIIRPMAYLDKDEVCEIAAGLQLRPVKNLCPLSVNTRREKVRKLLDMLYEDEPSVKNSLFAAMSNVRKDYLL